MTLAAGSSAYAGVAIPTAISSAARNPAHFDMVPAYRTAKAAGTAGSWAILAKWGIEGES